MPIKIFRGFLGNIIHICHFYILNTVAVGADKVTVRFGIAVKSVRAVSSGNFGNFPKLHQERQIPVYRSRHKQYRRLDVHDNSEQIPGCIPAACCILMLP